MKVKLFKDDAGETLTEEGNLWSVDVYEALRPLVVKAVKNGVSLRDLTMMVLDEITVLSAENRIRLGIEDRKNARETLKRIHTETVKRVINAFNS